MSSFKIIAMAVMFLCLLICGRSTFPIIYPPLEEGDVADNQTTHLFVALMMSFGFGGAFNSSGNVPGIELALDLINNRTDLLLGYKLHYILMDSQCNHEVALDVLFKQLFSATQRIGVIGAGCSVATEPTAEISHYYNITQLSCASSSHKLANRAKYRAYFQMIPTDINLIPAIVAVCKQYRWSHVAIIAQKENLFEATIQELTQLFVSENITWGIRSFASSQGPLSLGNKLFEERARIFFLAMYPGNARIVICQAYKAGLRYPRYSFIFYGWYSPNWWIPPANYSCTKEEMESVIHYSTAVLQHQFGKNNSLISASGISYEEYDDMYRKRANNQGYRYSINSVQCFDGMWSFALALNKTITELSENATLNMLARNIEGDSLSNVTEFKIELSTYKNNIVQQTMFNYLEKTDFMGISGEVSFTDLGIRTVNRLRVFQYRYVEVDGLRELRTVEYASVNPALNNYPLQYYSGESDDTVWPSGIIPYDGKAENKITSVAIPITVIYSLCAIAGIIFGVSFFIFIMAYRKHKLVRLTSPKLNIMVIIGAIVMYLSVILYTLPSYTELGTTILCNVRIQPRVFSIGYTLCFGTILAKMWRVYYIFTNPKPSRKAVKDGHLALFVFGALFIDILLLASLTAFNGGRTNAKLVRNMEVSSKETGELGYVTDYYTYICESREHNIWLAIVFGYKGLLQIAALFLAFGIRKVKMKGLNDSKFVGLTVYISSIILTAQVIVSIVLNQFLNTFAALLGTIIIINATVILGLLFIPQMVHVYRDPKGQEIYMTKTDDGRTSSNVLKEVSSLATSGVASGGNIPLHTFNGTCKEIIEDPLLSNEEKLTAIVEKLAESMNYQQNEKNGQCRKTSV